MCGRGRLCGRGQCHADAFDPSAWYGVSGDSSRKENWDRVVGRLSGGARFPVASSGLSRVRPRPWGHPSALGCFLVAILQWLLSLDAASCRLAAGRLDAAATDRAAQRL